MGSLSMAFHLAAQRPIIKIKSFCIQINCSVFKQTNDVHVPTSFDFLVFLLIFQEIWVKLENIWRKQRKQVKDCLTQQSTNVSVQKKHSFNKFVVIVVLPLTAQQTYLKYLLGLMLLPAATNELFDLPLPQGQDLQELQHDPIQRPNYC